MNDWVVGVDLGGTKVELGLVSPDDRIVVGPEKLFHRMRSSGGTGPPVAGSAVQRFRKGRHQVGVDRRPAVGSRRPVEEEVQVRRRGSGPPWPREVADGKVGPGHQILPHRDATAVFPDLPVPVQVLRGPRVAVPELR